MMTFYSVEPSSVAILSNLSHRLI